MYPQIGMKPLLQRLLGTLDFEKVRRTKSAQADPPTLVNEESEKSQGQDITHSWFWPHIGNWLQENDVVVTET